MNESQGSASRRMEVPEQRRFSSGADAAPDRSSDALSGPTTAHVIHAAVAVFWRDCVVETRQWHAINTVLMFALISLYAVSIGLRGDRLNMPAVASALLWVIIFFTAMSALSRSFVREEDSRTALALRLTAPALSVYLGKLAFNGVLMLALDALLLPGYLVLVNRPVHDLPLLVESILLGTLSLAASTTLLSAMTARAGSRSSLLAVISFPLLLPTLIMAIHASAVAYGLGGSAGGDLRFIFSYGMMCVVAALMLFPFVWWA